MQDEDPFDRFAAWMGDAQASEPNDPNAMILATASAAGLPAARTVLLKAWDARGFVFYTNLDSRKSAEIKQNPRAALLFHWKSRRRQIRIEGAVTRVDAAEADAYFATRPRGSQLGAWASAQSRRLPDRAEFDGRLAEVTQKFDGQAVPRPEFWSGWRVAPDYFEFWQDQEYRLHDRITYTWAPGGWEIGQLYP